MCVAHFTCNRVYDEPHLIWFQLIELRFKYRTQFAESDCIFIMLLFSLGVHLRKFVMVLEINSYIAVTNIIWHLVIFLNNLITCHSRK